MMGGTMRSPLTGIVFAVELTGNVDVLVSLLAATAASYAVTVLLLKRSILTEKIARRGRHLAREYSTDPFELLRASDVMVTVAGHRHKSYPLVDRDRRVIGMVGRTDVLRWSGSGDHAGLTLYDAVSDRSVVVTPPDIVLGRLVDLMIEHDVSRVPIVDPADRRLLGLVARKDLFKIRSNATAQENERTAYFGQSWRRPA